ncbi:hypothetical protein MA16_Dca027433 [Dendrobium catenatum]|uniref:Uncharacterized protein n=1 Tax=Dendrobium catenatum TaxID=906689 RepID=A0A2I0VED3_9ASPA|nr:hypothetical protein MA16_Dca027433 [Dendrobium catenatum]
MEGDSTRVLQRACTLVPSDSRLVLREVLRRRSRWCQRTRLLRHTGEGGSDFVSGGFSIGNMTETTIQRIGAITPAISGASYGVISADVFRHQLFTENKL